MEHLKMHSMNKIDENVSKIAQLFPNCVTEAKADDGTITKKIDFDMLKQELSSTLVDGREERYQFTWPDKKQAILTANAPINKTLRPCREESVDFDTTENLYIEGDNFEVLKLLQETYLGKIKLIYIDPPYNTGSDFIYEDDFTQDATEYMTISGQTDEDGNRLVPNTESNGRFHTDWLNMIFIRLKIAKDLLTDDGVIFISIGEEEIDNTIKVCNEIFGPTNKLGVVSRVAKTASNKGTYFAPSIDYVVCYGKNAANIAPFVGEVDKTLYKKQETDGPRKGEFYRDDVALYQSALDPMRGCVNQRYYIEAPDHSLIIPPGNVMPKDNKDSAHVPPESGKDKVWRWSYQTYLENKHLLVFKETKTSPLIDQNGNQAKYNIYTKSYLTERQETGTLPRNLWTDFINRKGADYLKKIGIPFDFSKPHELVSYILKIANIGKNDIILDFFSGSATTAESVIRTNLIDSGSRKFIMVQLPELTYEAETEIIEKENGEKSVKYLIDKKTGKPKVKKDSEANKEGFWNICEIGKERIRRAGTLIKQESGLISQNLDIGFRVLKCDSSNMEDVYYSPEHLDKQDLFKNNIKNGRTAEDLLFQVMLDLGIMLSSKIETKKINGKEVFCVEGNYLMACFDDSVDEKTITEIAKEKPYFFVMRDPANSKDGDSLITNFEQIFTTYSPDTVRKVL